VKQIKAQRKKLVLSTETIKALDPQRLADVAGGAVTYTCPPSTNRPSNGNNTVCW
jgi:hypothetical protein